MKLNFLKKMRGASGWVRDERGSGAVETVLIMPVLIFVYGACFVWFDAYRANTLAMKSTYTVSDILSRLQEVDEPYIDGLGNLLDYLNRGDDVPTLRVSSISFDDDVDEGENEYRLNWSYATNNVVDLKQLDLDTDISWIPVMGDGETVIVTETSVPYQTLFTGALGMDEWTNVMVTRPRFYGKLEKTDEPNNDPDLQITDDDGDNPVIVDNS